MLIVYDYFTNLFVFVQLSIKFKYLIVTWTSRFVVDKKNY